MSTTPTRSGCCCAAEATSSPPSHGHDHPGGHSEIDGVHYYTLVAMVEGSGVDNSGYAIVEVGADGIEITGYRRAESRRS